MAAYTMALANSLFFALFYLNCDVLQRRGVHFSVLQFNFSVVYFVLVVSLSLGYDRPAIGISLTSMTPTSWHGAVTLIGALLVGVFDTLARFALMFALRHVSAEMLSLFATLEIPFSYLGAFLLCGQRPDVLGGLGASMIFSALIIVNCEHLRSVDKPEEQVAASSSTDCRKDRNDDDIELRRLILEESSH